jgi:hypothetical protein
LLVAALFWEKSTVDWWLISETNMAMYPFSADRIAAIQWPVVNLTPTHAELLPFFLDLSLAKPFSATCVYVLAKARSIKCSSLSNPRQTIASAGTGLLHWSSDCVTAAVVLSRLNLNGLKRSLVFRWRGHNCQVLLNPTVYLIGCWRLLLLWSSNNERRD